MTGRVRHRGFRVFRAVGLGMITSWALLLARPALADKVEEQPTAPTAISPDESDRVMALVEPWQDGAEVAPGIRFTGASIDREIVCYLFEGKRTIEACVLPKVGAREVASSHRAALPDGISLVLRTPSDPLPGELELFAALQGALTRNATAEGLNELW